MLDIVQLDVFVAANEIWCFGELDDAVEVLCRKFGQRPIDGGDVLVGQFAFDLADLGPPEWIEEGAP